MEGNEPGSGESEPLVAGGAVTVTRRDCWGHLV